MNISKTNQIYIEIKKRILNNFYKEGEHIQEKEICETFNVSRTPVREAISRLAAENLIVSYPKKGSFVTSLSTQDILQLFQVRYIIEIAALNLAFENLEENKILEYKEKFINGIEVEDYPLLHELDYDFHNYINSKCRNQYLIDFLNRVQDTFQRVRTQEFYAKDRTIGGANEHIELINNIIAGNKEDSIKLLEEHIASTEKYYFKSLNTIN